MFYLKRLFCLELWLRLALPVIGGNYYFDVNGSGSDSGITNGGVYATSTTATNWTASSAGTAATAAFADRNSLIFSAGTDAAGLSYTVSGSLSQPNLIDVEDGYLTLSASWSGFSSPILRTADGTSLSVTGINDFYGKVLTFDALGNSQITLNSLATTSGRSGGITKTGPGLLLVSGAASARGITVLVSNGELRLQNANALFTSGYGASVTVTNGGSLEFSGGLTVTNNPITLSGYGYNNSGALRNFSGANLYGNPLTLSGDSRINADTNSVLTLNPAGTNAVNGPYGLTLGGDGAISVPRPIADAAWLVKDGNGVVTLSVSNSFSGPTIISAGTLLLLDGSLVGDVTNNATLAVSNSAAAVLPNRLAGTGQLLKQSASRLTLTATNDFAGAIVINAGALALATNASAGHAGLISIAAGAGYDVSAVAGFTLNANQTLSGGGAVTGAVTAVSGSRISPGGGTGFATLGFSNALTLAGGVTNAFDLSSNPNGSNDAIVVAGNLTLSGTNYVQVNYTTVSNGTYKLVSTVGGKVLGSVAGLQLAGFVPAAQVASLATNAADTEIDLVVVSNSHSPLNLIWTGNGNNNFWDETNTVAWRNGAAASTFYQFDRVTFDNTGGSNPVVTLRGALAPGALVVNAASDFSLTGGGALISPVSLVKSNSGTLTVSTTNLYSGGTLIAGGVVKISNAGALGIGAVTNNAALVFAPAGILNFTNVISGSGSVTNLGGTLVLSASNTFSGTTVVAGGTLQVGNPYALGAAGGGVSVGAGAVLDLIGQAIGAEAVTLNGGTLNNSSAGAASLAGTVTLSGNGVVSGVGDLALGGGVNGGGALTKSGTNTLTLGGVSGLTGPTTVAAGTLLVNGTSGPGAMGIGSGATLGGFGVVRGAVTNLPGGTISQGTNLGILTVNGAVTLLPGSTTVLKVGRIGSVPMNDGLAGISTLSPGGALVVTLIGNPVQDGDTFQLFAATNWAGSFVSVTLPWLSSGMVWDTSALTNGTLRAVRLPGVSTFAQRRMWALDEVYENPAGVEGFVLAETYFTRGNIALGQSAALNASRALANDRQVDFFDIWPALDCYIRFNQYLDAETKYHIQTNITQCTQYAGTTTSNLKTLGHIIRCLGSEQFGEAAFASNAIWKANDPSAYNDLLLLLANDATNGFGEHGSRPYYEVNLLPVLTLAQLTTNAQLANRALMTFQGGLSQNAGCWMRGHLGVSTSRSYPDEETQTPMGSMRLLWFYFGGDAPATVYTYPAFAAVMNYEPLPVIQAAGADRSAPYTSRGGYFGAQQVSFVDRDYVLFSEGPQYYGNFQVYADGVMWTDPDDSHFSFLWLCAPFHDDPAVVSGSWPHGMNRALYSEAQCRDSMLQIYKIDLTSTNSPDYALCYVPGGYRAAVNDSASTGKVFLHYGTVMIAISSDALFNWDTNSGIYAPSQLPVRAGDSEFRVTNVTQFAMAIETARPDLYPGATAADQLAAFRADILAHTGLSHAPGSPPTGYYTNRHGDTIQVLLSAQLSPSPIVVNGQSPDYNNWPLTDNPWIYQPSGGPLSLYDGKQTIVYNFNNWTITTNVLVAPPTGLMTSADSNGVYLTWQGRTGSTTYNVKRATVSGGPYAGLVSTTNTQWVDVTGAPGTTYYYVITATSGVTESTNSNEAGVLTLPAAPAGLSASLVGRTVKLDWNAAAGAAAYNLKRSTSLSGPYSILAGGLTGTGFWDSQFAGGGNFFYTVSAVNDAGESADASPQGVMVPANYFAAWSNRCAIVFTNYTQPETLTNFPALVVLNSSRPGFAYRQLGLSGRDLRFSDTALNELNYEIEKWDTNGNSYVWVQIPAFGSNTVIYAWWGNPAAAPPACTTNGATWGQDYLGVWHLAETNGVHRDSSPNRAVSRSVAATQQGTAPGVAGGCDYFNGLSDFVSLPDMGTNAQVTVECWVNLPATPGGTDCGLVSSDPWTGGITHFKTSSTFQIKGAEYGGSTFNSSSNVVATNSWFYAAYTVSGGGSADLDLYLNGAWLGSASGSTANNLTDVNIAREYGGRYLNARVDEVRLSSVPRSPNWLAATYQNIASNAVFSAFAPATALATNLAPVFSLTGVTNRQPHFMIGGAAGFAYALQASTNLLNWETLCTNVSGSVPLPWNDARGGEFFRRFYRVVLQP